MIKREKVTKTYTYDEIISKSCDICGTEYFATEEDSEVSDIKYYMYKDSKGQMWEIHYCRECIYKILKPYMKSLDFEPPTDY